MKHFQKYQTILLSVAEKYGEKVIEPSPNQSYQIWKTEGSYKSKIKQQLNYLLPISTDNKSHSIEFIV